MVESTRIRITATDYYQLPEYENNDLIQLVDGEVIIGMPPILKHQTIVKKVLSLLLKIETAKGGVAFVAPTEVRLDDENVLEPDLLYITPDNMAITRQDEKRIIGAPNLIIEVLSPGTAKFDRHEKYQAYEKNGVNEYWIIDPVHETVEAWNLGEAGRYERLGAFAGEDNFKSAVLDESISVKAIFNS